MDSATTQQQPNRLRWLIWTLWALALAGLVYLVGLTIWLGGSGLSFPYQLDYGEGFLIAGWVSLWHPVEILLYEWWPISRRIRIYESSMHMDIVFKEET